MHEERDFRKERKREVETEAKMGMEAMGKKAFYTSVKITPLPFFTRFDTYLGLKQISKISICNVM